MWKTKIFKVAIFLPIFVLMIALIFSGWPQIFNFPLGVQKAQAAITFNRTAGGSIITSPVSISVSADNFFGLGVVDFRYWRVEVRNAIGTAESVGGNFYSEIVPISELSRNFVISLPPDNYTDIVLLGCTSIENCNDSDAEINTYLEYNGGNTIFTVNE
jgi:hypothetical protein